MDEYASLIKLGIVIALILVIGLALRVMGFRYKALPDKNKTAKGKARSGKKSKAKNGDDLYYQQDAYVDDGEDGGEWNDDDIYVADIGKSGKSGKKKDKGADELESWEDY